MEKFWREIRVSETKNPEGLGMSGPSGSRSGSLKAIRLSVLPSKLQVTEPHTLDPLLVNKLR